MNNTKLIAALKYLSYALFLLLLFVLQTTPDFLTLMGIKPMLIMPAVVCIAMYEGEFVGGLFGALGGMLCDLASYTIFGFHAIFLLIICTGVGLAIIYLMKLNPLNAFLLCGGVMLVMGILEQFFYFSMWGYAGASTLIWAKMLPKIIYSLPFIPLFYWLFGRGRDFFASKVKT